MIGYEHITLIVNGLLLGGIYALIACGLTFTYGVCGLLNLAHGDFLILGGVICLLLTNFAKINPFLTILIIMPSFFVAGSVIYRAVLHKITIKSPSIVLLSSILITTGLSFVIEDSLAYVTNTILNIPFYSLYYTMPPVRVSGYELPIPSTRFFSFMLIIFLTIAFHYFIKRTRTGILIRAITEDREAAVMIGACVKRISTITFGIGAAIAAVSGVFIILITCVTAFHGLVLTVKALTVIILGGMGSFPGAILGGMILGLSETYTAYFLGGEWANLISILVLIIVLIVKPSGMFGRRWT